jgi:diguanylate cyclase (GGDEF)-like protein
MSAQSSILQARVSRLRQRYLGKLPGILAEAGRVCASLASGSGSLPMVDDLHRLFHNLKGTSASLGLLELSQESARAADLLISLRLSQPFDQQEAQQLGCAALADSIHRLGQLEQEAAAAWQHDNVSPAVLPVAEPDVPPAEPRTRVVFLCDEDLDGEQLGGQLACFGYAVSSFTDPDQFRAGVVSDPPDALVVSLKNVEPFAELARKTGIPLLFVADSADFLSRLKAVQAGGDAYFLKPVAAHEMIDTLDAVTVRHEPEPFRVLIVDDEPEVADYHGLILESVGMIVRRLNNPLQLLEALGEFQPDLVLMDMYMPIGSGRELSRVIRQIPQFVSLPIIFLSSETDKDLQVSAMRVGADGFLTKPILPEDLINAVGVRAERTRVLRSLMMRDSLTGLLNRATLSQFLGSSLSGSQRHGVPLSFVMLDLDYFKRVNDSYGHPAGDQVLVALARILKQRLRHSDMAGRYGGEEFGAVLLGADAEEAWILMDQIRRDFNALVFTSAERSFSCSFSCGIACHSGLLTAEAMTRVADRALYDAKNAGRNQVWIAAAEDIEKELQA